MSSARIPWWIWLIAAAFVACFLVGYVYLPLKLPEATGININFRDNRVASVRLGSPGYAAGLKQDDRIINVDGRAVQNSIQVGSVLCNTIFDHPVSIVVSRGSQEVHLHLTLNQTLMRAWTSKEYLGWWVETAASLIQLLVGLLVLSKRPRDLTAVAAGIFLCCLGTGNAWDIWALAVITYEMLTGTHPFPATSLGQMQYSIVNGRFTPLPTHLPDAPAEWQQFFERALNAKTALRLQSAKEFVSTLGKAFALIGKTPSG